MIAIIDYGAGNLRSVEKALTAIGEESIVTRDRHEILNAEMCIRDRSYRGSGARLFIARSLKTTLGCCLKEAACTRYITVSYTHLDVYKRQILGELFTYVPGATHDILVWVVGVCDTK